MEERTFLHAFLEELHFSKGPIETIFFETLELQGFLKPLRFLRNEFLNEAILHAFWIFCIFGKRDYSY